MAETGREKVIKNGCKSIYLSATEDWLIIFHVSFGIWRKYQLEIENNFLTLTGGYFYWLERARKRERAIDVRQKHLPVASHTCPDWLSNPQHGFVPWPGIEPTTFWWMEQHSSQLNHPARATKKIVTIQSGYWGRQGCLYPRRSSSWEIFSIMCLRIFRHSAAWSLDRVILLALLLFYSLFQSYTFPTS